MSPYTLTDLVEDLRCAYGRRATSEAISLLIEARNRSLLKERDLLTMAAIMLCEPPEGRLLS
jgi:hypothetical protein